MIFWLRRRQRVITIKPTVLLDPENLGVAVGISLLSHVQTEIYAIAYVLSVNGDHLSFISHPDSGEYPHMSCCVAGSKKMGVAFGNLMMSRSIYDIPFTSGFTAAILIFVGVAQNFSVLKTSERMCLCISTGW